MYCPKCTEELPENVGEQHKAECWHNGQRPTDIFVCVTCQNPVGSLHRDMYGHRATVMVGGTHHTMAPDGFYHSLTPGNPRIYRDYAGGGKYIYILHVYGKAYSCAMRYNGWPEAAYDHKWNIYSGPIAHLETLRPISERSLLWSVGYVVDLGDLEGTR